MIFCGWQNSDCGVFYAAPCERLYVSNKISTVLKFNSKFNVNMYIVIWTTYNTCTFVCLCLCYVMAHNFKWFSGCFLFNPFALLYFLFISIWSYAGNLEFIPQFVSFLLFSFLFFMKNKIPHQSHNPHFSHNEKKSKFYTLLQIYIREKYTILNLYTA